MQPLHQGAVGIYCSPDPGPTSPQVAAVPAQATSAVRPAAPQLGARIARAPRFTSGFTVPSSPCSPVVFLTGASPVSPCLAINPNIMKAESPALCHTFLPLPSKLPGNLSKF